MSLIIQTKVLWVVANCQVVSLSLSTFHHILGLSWPNAFAIEELLKGHYSDFTINCRSISYMPCVIIRYFVSGGHMVICLRPLAF